MLFRKFASDFAEKYRMPVLQLDEKAKQTLINYRWEGNVRQLKNITEQISIIEKDRDINNDVLLKYLPKTNYSELPVLYQKGEQDTHISERDILYKVLFDMKKDINDLKKIVIDIIQNEGNTQDITTKNSNIINQLYQDVESNSKEESNIQIHPNPIDINQSLIEPIQQHKEVEESLSLQKKEIDLIKRALIKYKGKRKCAANELGISERTLYRKIKEFDI